MTVAQYVPQMTMSLLAGAWADRTDPLSQIVFGRTFCFLGPLLTLCWYGWRWEDASSVEAIVAVSAGAFVLGVGFAIGGPAIQAVVPSLVRRGELTTVMALNTLPLTLGRIVGPSAGALTTVAAGPAVAFLVGFLGQAAFIPVVALLRLPRRAGRKTAVRGAVWEGLRFIRGNRRVAGGLLGALGIGLGAEPILTLAPALADELGKGDATVGLMATSFGVGAALALLLVSTLGNTVPAPTLAMFGLTSLVAGLLGCAVLPTEWLCLAAAAAQGVGFSVGLTGLSTIVQGGTPDAVRGRVMSVWVLAFIGSRPLSVGVTGFVADLTSVRVAFAFVAFAILGLMLASVGRSRSDPG